MKKLILANCILAVAVIFTFCARPESIEELSNISSSNDRGGPGGPGGTTCILTNIPPVNTADLTFCGTNTNGESCFNCANSLIGGLEFFAAGVPVNLAINAPITFSVRGSIQTTVNLTASGGAQSTGPVFIPFGGCQNFTIDANCNITPVK